MNLPLKDDATVKEYLLRPQRRASLLQSQGAVVSSIQGAQALQPMLSSRSFVCLHYRVGVGGVLQPCTVDPSPPDVAPHTTNPAWYGINVLPILCIQHVVLRCCKELFILPW